MTDNLPWGPTSDMAAPDPWTPTMDLAVETDLDSIDYDTVVWDPNNLQAHICADEGSWSDCPP